MLKKLLGTENDLAGLVLRLSLGIVFFPHGAQKVLGWFGGYGFIGTMGFFTQKLGIPAPFAFLAIVAEFFGAIGLVVGLLTRVAAFGIACDMVVAVVMLHWQNGFFMNWAGNLKGEGFEYHILVVAIALALMIRGGGLWSLDGKLAKKLDKPH
jgi:putative oxidoreductase